jgi:hypothetical protein
MNIKVIGWSMVLCALISCGAHIKGCVSNFYTYQNNVQGYWDLADKSSTIKAKQEYVNQFVTILENTKHSGYDAIIYKIPNSSFDFNLKALKSLRDRLETIREMDESSFAYQTAIQQITAQEQGEAHEMLSVFYGCYTLVNYWPAWGWLGGLVIAGYCILFIIGCCILFKVYDF